MHFYTTRDGLQAVRIDYADGRHKYVYAGTMRGLFAELALLSAIQEMQIEGTIHI